MFMNTQDQYGLVSRTLHWLLFVLVVGMLSGGILLQLLPNGGLKAIIIGVHKSTGVIVGLLAAVRLVWRIGNPRPKPLSANPVENYLAALVHIVLYILLLLQPLTGILMSQAYGYGVSVFGLFTVPTIVWESPRLGLFFGQCHTVVAVLLMLFVAVHVGAALKHHFVNRDRTLLRMLKGH